MNTIAPDYRIQRVEIKTSAGPQVAYYVTSPAGTVYTVQLAGHGRHHACCNCPHYLHRCAGTRNACKHILCVQREEFGRLEEETADQEAAARKRERVLREREMWAA